MTRSTACKGMSTPAQLGLSSRGSLGVLAASPVCLARSALARSMISSRVAQVGHAPRAPTDPGLGVEDARGSSTHDFATPPIDAVDHAGRGKAETLFQSREPEPRVERSSQGPIPRVIKSLGADPASLPSTYPSALARSAPGGDMSHGIGTMTRYDDGGHWFEAVEFYWCWCRDRSCEGGTQKDGSVHRCGLRQSAPAARPRAGG